MPEPRIIKAAAVDTPTIELVTLPRVHLASVGRWLTSTGIWDCAPEDLAAIVEAQGDPGIRTGIIKLGHGDKVSEIEMPAVGRVENLVLSEDGMDLYGDLVGVPKWLATILPSAFPSRSVEVAIDYVGSTGHQHRAVLQALAVLGETTPAIESLDDVRALYEGEYEELVAAAAKAGATRIVGTPPDAVRELVEAEVSRRLRGRRVEAAVSVDQVRQAFYEALSAENPWAWIRECWVGDGSKLIVDNDEGDLYEVPWTEADGTVTFGDPVRVVVQYVPAPPKDEEEASGLVLAGRWGGSDPRLVKASGPDKPEEGKMELKDLLARVGLPEDATEEQYEARLGELAELAAAPAPPAPPAKPELPEGVVVMDEEQVAELVSAARKGEAAHTKLANDHRDTVIKAAVAEGKFAPSRVQHWTELWEKDPEGTEATIASLAKGLLPTSGAPVGHAATVEASATDDEALWDSELADHFAGLAGQEG